MTTLEEKPRGWWRGTPLYIRIVIAMVLGVLVGLWLGPAAKDFAIPAKLVLRLLGALAPGLILVAIIHVLLTAELERRSAGRLIFLLVLNTLVAIGIGLLVANVVKPGAWHGAPALPTSDSHLPKADSVLTQILDNIPKSLFGPLTDDGKVIGVIFIALAFGLALRAMPAERNKPVASLVAVLLPAFIKIVHWIIELVPIAVFGLVAAIIGEKGFGAFKALGAFVVAVIFALALQALYYLTRIRLGSWVRPWHLLRNTRDALVMAFSTGSSTATMPLTFQCLRERVGLREKSASLGALVGANFNNDGTALYEAMSALFVSQMLVVAGVVEPLTLTQQMLVVITSVFASVGAAGIPEAGLVTMTLVFKAVGLPVEYIALLLPVDWFLDRCRTCINVMGDMNVACLLDGRERAAEA
jgi:DAACS family dicarboxylate/amino acid:cation (Na+ or H+) symporter